MAIAELYTKPNCTYCVQAKMLLQREKIEYVELDAVNGREELIERVTKATGKAPTSVPQIWLDGQYIGGFKELSNYINAAQ